MAIAAGLQNVGIDAAAAVADENADMARRIFQFDFDFAGVGVAESGMRRSDFR